MPGLPGRQARHRVLKAAQALAAALAIFAVLPLAGARQHRSHFAKVGFQHLQPSPATGRKRGKCPGYVVDHVNPLVCGGADAPSNMHWQTQNNAKAKDKWERKACGR